MKYTKTEDYAHTGPEWVGDDKFIFITVHGRENFGAEGVETGALQLVGTDEEVIYNNFKLLLEDNNEYEKMCKACNSYGDDNACKQIADVLEFAKYDAWSAE